jgi:hypothetical protein
MMVKSNTFMQTHAQLHAVALYISSIAGISYLLLALNVTIIESDVRAMLFIPSRWTLNLATMPAIWCILSHGSSYNFRQKLYVIWLNLVLLAASGLATIPGLSWGHKTYWMAISCAPIPEIFFHTWCVTSRERKRCAASIHLRIQ